jgi:hypothetical protein
MLQLRLDEFTWERPTSRRKGFCWEPADGDLRLARVPGADFKPYQPDPGLCRDFADLPRTADAALKFANRYGALHQRLEFNSFSFWRKGIEYMCRLVALGDAVIQGDWRKIPGALEPFLRDPALAGSDDIRPLREKQKRGESLGQSEQIHAALTRLVRGCAPLDQIALEGSWNRHHRRAEVRLRHENLLGFMLFQLAQALLGNRRFRQCAECGKWSLLAPQANRANRITCSDYCRLKRCRKRRTKALELGRRGWSVKRIAAKIGSKPSTVERWLAQVKRSKPGRGSR